MNHSERCDFLQALLSPRTRRPLRKPIPGLIPAVHPQESDHGQDWPRRRDVRLSPCDQASLQVSALPFPETEV
jgi:hypothetical protein